jgi:hypothetical protein
VISTRCQSAHQSHTASISFSSPSTNNSTILPTTRPNHTKQPQLPITMKHCTICGSDASSLRISPQHGQQKHEEHERACDECWEAWISLQVEKNKPDEIRCMFTDCASLLDFEQIEKLARKGTVYRSVHSQATRPSGNPLTSST